MINVLILGINEAHREFFNNLESGGHEANMQISRNSDSRQYRNMYLLFDFRKL